MLINKAYVNSTIINQHDLVLVSVDSTKKCLLNLLFMVFDENKSRNNLYQLSKLVTMGALQKRIDDWIGVAKDFVWDEYGNCSAIVSVMPAANPNHMEDYDDTSSITISVPVSCIKLFRAMNRSGL